MIATPRRLPALAGAAALLALAGCPKKPPTTDGDDDGFGASVESFLQVVSVDPSSVGAQTSVPARISGGGFQSGATVTVGDQAATGVRLVDENTLDATLPPLPDGTYDVRVVNPDGRSATLYGGLLVGSGIAGGAECQDIVVYFALDQAGLTAEARSTLDARADCFISAPVRLRVEGHADERGTTDYNLALGQRRAESVQRHLTGLGVAPDRMETVSWGEERPADPSSNERAWAANRRVEVQILR